MVQENELFNLLMAVIGLLAFQVSLKKVQFPGAARFRLGFFVMLSSFVFTIIEGFVWPRFFNLLEHMAYAVAGILFCLGCWQLSRNPNAKDTRRPETR